MPKKNIHPKWHKESKVYCNGAFIMTTSSTQPKITVDIWSGNHPFYTKSQRLIDTEGRIEKFLKKYKFSPNTELAIQP
nr:ribosomal protein L31 [Cryptomonas paramecium]